jgi:hypothetical protein
MYLYENTKVNSDNLRFCRDKKFNWLIHSYNISIKGKIAMFVHMYTCQMEAPTIRVYFLKSHKLSVKFTQINI